MQCFAGIPQNLSTNAIPQSLDQPQAPQPRPVAAKRTALKPHPTLMDWLLVQSPAARRRKPASAPTSPG